MKIRKICEFCGVDFIAKNRAAKYCSISCNKKDYWIRNKEEIKKKKKEYYKNNKEKFNNDKEYAKLKNKEWNTNNKERKSEYDSKYYKKNKDAYLERNKKYYKKRIKTDSLYKIKRQFRAAIYDSFKRKGYKKCAKTEQVLGCTVIEFKEHLERKFKEGMTWDNYGHKGWHIDHKKPLKKAKTPEEVAKLCHYTNLQPLWWKENLEKSDKEY